MFGFNFGWSKVIFEIVEFILLCLDVLKTTIFFLHHRSSFYISYIENYIGMEVKCQ